MVTFLNFKFSGSCHCHVCLKRDLWLHVGYLGHVCLRCVVCGRMLNIPIMLIQDVLSIVASFFFFFFFFFCLFSC